MRRVFLWAARNTWLKEHLPRLPFMQRAVRRFMPGETMESALDAAAPLQAAGIATMYTRLGENLDEPRRGGRGRRPLHRGPRRDPGARARRRDLGQADPARPRPRRGPRRSPTSTRLAAHAADDRLVPLDRHGGQRLRRGDIRLYERLRAVQPRTGICLQAYLKRTAADIERLLPLDPAIRLVKGAYDEPAAIAYRDKRGSTPTTSGSPCASCSTAAAGRSGSASAPTTSSSSSRSPRRSRPAGIGRDGFEIEMLYGIRTGEQHPTGARPATGSRRSSPTASTGIRGTCAGSPSGRPT